MIERRLLVWVGLTIFINALLMFSPFLIDTDTTVYFIIAKNMALHGHWLDLISSQGPWLDKPHLPFWLTALSFTLFGCHPWSYILPGFIFYMIGGLYTYKVARLLYNNEIIAWLSLLITVTTLRLMLSSLDVRAEAYLLGEIMPACYYWLKYHEKTKIQYLLLGALFTGCALMTKGIFVLVTIGSGMMVLWVYQKQLKNFVSIKWLLAVVLSFICALPEFMALYAQFSLEGLRWFFVGSQFGRFFDTGRIVKHNGHIFFFAQTFLWAFLPWSIVFLAALCNVCQNFKAVSIDDKKAFIYLGSTFFVTFLMFSLSKFQLDYYINIVFPFAAILSARYLYDLIDRYQKHSVFTIQLLLSSSLLIVIILINVAVSWEIIPYFMLLDFLPIGLLIYMLKNQSRLSALEKGVVYPAISITIVFLVLMLIQAVVISKLNVGYVMANYINHHDGQLPVYEYQRSSNLSIYLKKNTFLIKKSDQLPLNSSYYLVTESGKHFSSFLKKWPSAKIVFEQDVLDLRDFTRHIFLRQPVSDSKAPHMILLKVN